MKTFMTQARQHGKSATLALLDEVYELGRERWTIMGVVVTPENGQPLLEAEAEYMKCKNRQERRRFLSLFRKGPWPGPETDDQDTRRQR